MDVGHFDGACEPRNPGGHLGMGWHIVAPDGALLAEGHAYEPAGPATSNNVAEYLAAVGLLRAYLNLRMPGPIEIRGDSMLVIRQITGEWRVKGGHYVTALRQLRVLVDEAREREIRIVWRWVPRERNEIADALSKKALAEHGISPRNWKV